MREKPDRVARCSACRSDLVLLDPHHLGPRHHHLTNDGVAEIEDALQHLAFGFLHDAAAAGDVDQFAQFDVGGERALPEAAAGGDRVADQDQQRGDR